MAKLIEKYEKYLLDSHAAFHEHLGNPKLKALRVMRTDFEKAAKNINAWLDMAAHFNIIAHHENKTL